ncbi:unnamed protein product [Linum tenue]|uniref:Late embryogenesis abundant protein LEA-2 subgroup domain-containing protein n=1 Tax=Linum tenue TaxID=586396 RepID=A0AAV0N6V2_9ROSI|nr:unnamed protein product [Linum tenue]
MGSQPESPLLPQHHIKKPTYAAAGVVFPKPTDDPPPPPSLPPSPPVDNDDPNSHKPEPEFECSPRCLRVTAVLGVLLLIGIPIYYVIEDQLAPYSPKANVVSAFVSIKKSNTSNGPAAGRLTANWAFTLHLDNSLPCCQAVYPYRVEASVYHQADGGGGPARDRRVLASTRQFAGLSVDPKVDDLTFFIQLGADGADVGENVTAAVYRDLAELEQNRLRFRAVILVWVRIEPYNFGSRYYLARISCDPFWTGSASIAGKSLDDNKECQVHVIEQSHPSSLDQNRTRLNATTVKISSGEVKL